MQAKDQRFVLGKTITQETTVSSVQFSPCGNYVAWSCGDSLGLQDLSQECTIVKKLQIHNNDVSQISYSPTEQLVASAGGQDNATILWDLETMKSRNTFVDKQGFFESHTQFSPDGKMIASSNFNKLKLYSVRDKQVVARITLPEQQVVNSFSFSPDGKILAYGTDSNLIYLWSIAEQRNIHSYANGDGRYTIALNFSQDGNVLASSNSSCKINILSMKTNQLIDTLDGNSDAGQQTVIESGEGEVMEVEKNQVDSLTFSPNGKFLVSGGQDGKVRVWKRGLRPLHCVQTTLCHDKQITQVSMSPKGDFASSSNDGTVKIWTQI